MDKLCHSKLWDSNLTWYTSSPDLTECFKNTVLSWFPSAVLLLFLPLEIISYVRSKSKNIPWSLLNVTKMVLVLILVGLSVVEYFVSDVDMNTDLYISALTVKCVTYVAVLVLILCGRKFGIHSSGILLAFWLISTLVECILFYSFIKETLHVDSVNPLKVSIHSVILIATFIIFLLSNVADKKPRNNDSAGIKNIRVESPEMWASFTSKIFIHWLNGFLWKSRRTTLNQSDIYELNHDQKALNATVKLHKQLYSGETCKEGTFSKISVLPRALRAFAPQLIPLIIIHCVALCYGCTSPLWIGFLIDFATNDEPTWKGWLYSMSFILSITFHTVCQIVYKTQSIKPTISIKSSVVATVFKKVLKLSNSARERMEIGEILNAMSCDADGISNIFNFSEASWVASFILISFTYLLWINFGVSAIIGILIILLTAPLTIFLSKMKVRLQAELMRIKDRRVKKMSEVLSGIRVIKMYGWESSFQKQILQYRQEEYAILKKISIVLAMNIIMFLVLPTISQFSIFAFYVLYEEKPLTAYAVFTSYAIVNVLRWTVNQIPELTNSLTTALVSSSRINRILNSKERRNYVKNGKHKNDANDSIEVINATFGWSTVDIILRNISIQMKRGSLVAAVGQVGSGKSSLIAAILGEMEKYQGEVIVNGSTGYVPQQPWILNCSLKENILFGRPFETEKYRAVIEACALGPDIETLPAYDDTEIGEKGINLSGGQKQRVSLARALYGDFDIYLLDDPLGAVDSHVAKHIFTHVIGPQGRLRNKTRLLVTHNESFLNEMDEIYVMSNGVLVRKPNSEIPFVQEDDTEWRILKDKSYNVKTVDYLKTPHKVSPMNEERTLVSKEINGTKHRLTKDEKTSVNLTAINVYWQYLKAIGFFNIGFCYPILALQPVLTVGSMYWIALWVDDVAANVEEVSTNQRLLVYALLSIGQIFLVCLGCIYLQLAGVKAAQKLHSNMLSSVLSSPMSFFDVTPSGRILNRFTMDMNETDIMLPDTMLKLITGVCVLIVSGVAVSIRVPFMVILLVFTAVVMVTLQRLISKSSQQLKRLESATKSPLYSHFSETVAGAHVIRAQGEFQRFHLMLIDLLDKHNAVFYLNSLTGCWMMIHRVFVCHLFLVVVCILLVVLKGEFGAGMAGYIIANAYSVNAFLPGTVFSATRFESAIVCVERIMEFTHLESEGNISKKKRVPVNWPNKGKISFQGYFTRYRQELEFVLEDITFQILPKEKVGVVGRTGSGKSSLTLALFRIIEAASGHIFIDDQNIAEIDLSILRSRLTIIPQDPVLFSGSLRMNLDPFDQHEDHELWFALDHAHLKDFTATLNDGLQHQISEGGQNLSVGQRQLVCLARALLRKSMILVLDEATASVDYETDELIQNTIRKEFWDCTIITIAHRLNTILDYDRVMVLDHGTLVEFDKPSALLKDASSLFFGLARDAGIVN